MCVEEALKDPDWLLAMHEELNNFTRNDVWVLEPPPKTRTTLASNRSFTTKYGLMVRNKVRLVTKDFSQVEGNLRCPYLTWKIASQTRHL
jgi:hypothetical protein